MRLIAAKVKRLEAKAKQREGTGGPPVVGPCTLVYSANESRLAEPLMPGQHLAVDIYKDGYDAAGNVILRVVERAGRGDDLGYLWMPDGDGGHYAAGFVYEVLPDLVKLMWEPSKRVALAGERSRKAAR